MHWGKAMWGHSERQPSTNQESTHQKPSFPAPWKWASSLQSCEKVTICCLNHPVCGLLLWQPEQTKTSAVSKKERYKIPPVTYLSTSGCFLVCLFFLATQHVMQDLSSPNRIEPVPLRWKLRVLTIRPPGKSLCVLLTNGFPSSFTSPPEYAIMQRLNCKVNNHEISLYQVI